jgi:hypothetical protein
LKRAVLAPVSGRSTLWLKVAFGWARKAAVRSGASLHGDG